MIPTASMTHHRVADDTVYGVLQLGPVLVALPLEVLREVIPCPPQFSGLPASAHGLLGAVGVRGRVVPVLDLRVVLGLPAPQQPGQVVVLLRHQKRVLGLLADGVRGLTQPPANGLNSMACSSIASNDEAEAPGTALLFGGSFERSEDQSVVSVLDAAALMRLPGLPLLRDEDAAGAAATAPIRSSPMRALMLMRCGDIRLAMDVTEIHTTLPRVTLQASSLDGRVCHGVIDHAEVRLPAIDPLALMNLGSLPAGEPCQAIVLRYETGLVALLVSQVIDIARVPESDLLPLSPLAVHRPELFRAALRVAGHGEHLVLREGALHHDAELRTLATLNTRTASLAGAGATGLQATAVAAARANAVITYDIGVEVATRLAQIGEVLPLPADCSRPTSPHPAVIGLFTHRGHSVTLVCLSSLLHGSERPDPSHARVLLVTQDDAHFGFVVPRLCHIENTVWEQPRSAAKATKPSTSNPLGSHAVVELGLGTHRRTLQLIDLRALVRSMLGGAAEPASPALEASVTADAALASA